MYEGYSHEGFTQSCRLCFDSSKNINFQHNLLLLIRDERVARKYEKPEPNPNPTRNFQVRALKISFGFGSGFIFSRVGSIKFPFRL